MTDVIETDKIVLDACCGGRMFWFDKNHPDVLYVDKEVRPRGCISQQSSFSCSPDLVADFRQLPFKDETFKLVVFDPPHRKNLVEKSIFRQKYGSLNKETWQEDLAAGFRECWRVLDNHGVLVFKWSETFIPLKIVLALFSERPLFGHPTWANGKTIWCVFFKNIKSKEVRGA